MRVSDSYFAKSLCFLRSTALSSARPEFFSTSLGLLTSSQSEETTMGWLRKVTIPFRRIWRSVFSKLRPRKLKRGNGMGKLYNDVLSCGYEDVRVMWSMLHDSHYPLDSPKKHGASTSFAL